MSNKEEARKLLKAGLSAIPCTRKEKRPVGYAWKTYQTERMDENELGIFDQFDGVGIICGAVSGGLEVLDFDDGGSQLSPWLDLLPDELRDRLVHQRTPSGGAHVLFRCSEIEGNQKLATGEDRQVLIETRGEGGLIVCAPTEGYRLTYGSFDRIPIVTPDERETMLVAARSLNRLHETKEIEYSGTSYSGATPWGEYNQRGDFRQVLLEAGWTKLGMAADGNEHWRRPGKDKDNSATIKNIDGCEIFYCFTSNGYPFKPSKGETPFGVLCLLKHGGDVKAAVQDVRNQGFCGDDFIGQLKMSVGNLGEQEDKDEGPEPLPDGLIFPGLVQEVAEYALATAMYPQPVFALAAGLAIAGLVTGRKIKDKRDTRTNLLCLCLGYSGSGKEHGRRVCGKLMLRAGYGDMIGTENVKSSSAILSELNAQPACLLMLDEVQGLFGAITKRRAGNHVESIPDVIKSAYSSASNEMWKPAGYADRKNNVVINQPHLVTYCTGVPDAFWDAVDYEMMTTGLMGRMLLFEHLGYPDMEDPEPIEPTEELLARIKQWCEYQPGGNLDTENPQAELVPIGESANDRLKQHFRDIRTRLPDDRDLSRAIWSRSGEKASQLALLAAASRSEPGSGFQVTLADAELAIRLSNWCTRRMVYCAENKTLDSEYGKLSAKILERIPTEWTSKRTITRRTMKLCDRSQRDRIIYDLIESGAVEMEQEETTGRPLTLMRRKGVRNG